MSNKGTTFEFQTLAPRFPFLKYNKIPNSKFWTKVLFKVVEKKVFENCYPVSCKSGDQEYTKEDKEITMEWNCFPTVDNSAIEKMADALRSSINIHEMRNATKEERENVDTYIKKHSTPSGIILANDGFVNDINRIMSETIKRKIDADIMKELYMSQIKGDKEDDRKE